MLIKYYANEASMKAWAIVIYTLPLFSAVPICLEGYFRAWEGGNSLFMFLCANVKDMLYAKDWLVEILDSLIIHNIVFSSMIYSLWVESKSNTKPFEGGPASQIGPHCVSCVLS